MLPQLFAGILLAIVISYLAFRARTLSASGMAAAALLGAVVFGLGGLRWAALLLGFFVSSSLLSRLFKRRKAALSEKFSKGSVRDWEQVLANGGIAGIFVLFYRFLPGAEWAWAAFAGAMAAVNADTWATELGVLSKASPRLITTFGRVERGTSGGVSLAGTLAALGGSGLIALLAALLWEGGAGTPAALLAHFGVVTLAGLAGSLLDSLLGATLQAIYTCPACGKETERHPLHTCGTRTVLKRGLSWLDNDWVNASCSLMGSLAALGLFLGAGTRLASTPAVKYTSTAPQVQENSRLHFPFYSYAFEAEQPIPDLYTCKAENVSPPLRWYDFPDGTSSFALIADDPDAPFGTFTHWVLYNIPAERNFLPEGMPSGEQLEGGLTQGFNGFGQAAYGGPCPPAGKPHRYYFTLYALNLPADLPAGLDVDGLRSLIQDHTLAQSVWMGTYQR